MSTKRSDGERFQGWCALLGLFFWAFGGLIALVSTNGTKAVAGALLSVGTFACVEAWTYNRLQRDRFKREIQRP
jgi:hypothetical protein